MKLFSFVVTAAILSLTIAVPVNDEVESEVESRSESILQKRNCPTNLSSAKCHGSSSAGGGVYCGYCVEVLGTDWAVGNHKYYAYQINGGSKACCSYGYRTSCETNYGSRSQCPI
jgi:hypothetical protein